MFFSDVGSGAAVAVAGVTRRNRISRKTKLGLKPQITVGLCGLNLVQEPPEDTWGESEN